MGYHLGVDVGTTYTAAAIGRDGRVEAATLGTRSVAVPSVVGLSGDRFLVGEAAARRAVTDPRGVAREFKRRVGDPTPLLLGGAPVAAELLMARTVEWVVEQVSTTEGQPPESLALTHPANWGEYKLDLFRQALRHVGLAPDHLVPEPVAAATAYAAGRALAPGTIVAVYDLGGGTFDAALVRARAAADAAGGGQAEIVGRPDGIERLGGIDFDHAVFRHVLDAIGLDPDRLDPDDPAIASGLAQLREECVEAKEALSHEQDVSIPVMLPQRHTEVRMLRRELEAMIRPALDETLVALRRAVDSAGVRVDDVAAVLLVGGSSRIPLVGELVAAELGRPVAVDARPKDTIPMGAALVAMTAAVGSPPHAHVPTPGFAAGAAASAGARALAAGPGSPAPPTPANGGAPASPFAGVATGPPTPAAPPPGHMPPPLPPAAPDAARGRGRRGLLTAAALLAVAGVAVAAFALGNRGGGDEQAEDPTTSVSAPPETAPDSTLPTGTVDPTGSGSGTTPAPLPGDDWNPDARTRFVEDCASSPTAQMAGTPAEVEALCGCVYDDMSTSTDFDEFNAQYSSPDFDPSSPIGQALTAATFSCAGIG
jgi:hypothetical protein